MRKLFMPFVFLLITSSGKLSETKSVIYHSVFNETVTVRLATYHPCISVIDCGTFKDSVRLSHPRIDGIKNERVLTIQTHGQDIYGWSDGDVNYTVE